MFPMGLMANGERAEVVENRTAAPGARPAAIGHVHRTGCFRCCGSGRDVTSGRALDMGLRPGKVVEMLSNEGHGVLLVKVDESRIAVGRAVAMKIMVRRPDDESRDA